MSALEFYALDTGRVPTTGEGLDALLTSSTTNPPARWSGPYLKDLAVIPLDPWGNPYRYRTVEKGGLRYILASYGADGRPGGSGYAADVLSEPDFDEAY